MSVRKRIWLVVLDADDYEPILEEYSSYEEALKEVKEYLAFNKHSKALLYEAIRYNLEEILA